MLVTHVLFSCSTVLQETMADDDLNESQQRDKLAGAITQNGLPFRQIAAIMYDIAIANVACLVYMSCQRYLWHAACAS